MGKGKNNSMHNPSFILSVAKGIKETYNSNIKPALAAKEYTRALFNFEKLAVKIESIKKSVLEYDPNSTFIEGYEILKTTLYGYTSLADKASSSFEESLDLLIHSAEKSNQNYNKQLKESLAKSKETSKK